MISRQIDYDARLVCCQCGSTNVAQAVWVNPNDMGDLVPLDNAEIECQDCPGNQQPSELITPTEYSRRLGEIEADYAMDAHKERGLL